MKYQINGIKISPEHDDIKSYLKDKYSLDKFEYKILLKSIDARNKNNVFYLYNVMVDTNKKLAGKILQSILQK